jgi:hypothetical protein
MHVPDTSAGHEYMFRAASKGTSGSRTDQSERVNEEQRDRIVPGAILRSTLQIHCNSR